MLHEPLDGPKPAAGRITEAVCDLGLALEHQTVVAAPGNEMQMAPNGPEKVFALFEAAELIARKHALVGELTERVGAVQEFGDPKQCVQVAQAALAVLDVGLDDVTALSGPRVALVTFRELGRNERLGLARHGF